MAERPPAAAASGRAARAKTFLRLGAGAALVGLLVAAIDVRALLRTVRGIETGPLLVACAFTLAVNLIKPLRWQLLLRTAVPGVSYRVALRSLLVAACARTLLPTKLGEFARIGAVKGLSLTVGATLASVDILLEAAAVIFLASFGAFSFLGAAPAAALMLASMALLVGLARPARLFRVAHGLRAAAARWWGAVRARLAPPGKLDGADAEGPPGDPVRSERLTREAGLSSSPAWGYPTVAQGFFLTLVLNGLRYAQLALLLSALGQLASGSALMLMPFIQLSDSFPVSLGGVGPRELVGFALLPRVGVEAEAAVAAILAQTLISNLLPTAVGLLWLGGYAVDPRRLGGEPQSGTERVAGGAEG